jgi:hypothetical protein
MRRRAILRASAVAISRVQAPGGAAGPDGPRAAALDEQSTLLELVTVRVAGLGADVGGPRVPRPEQHAPSSRAPPVV